MIARPIRVGMIGVGRISDLHAIEYLQNPDTRLVALCDRNMDGARTKAANWGLNDIFITDDMDQVFSDPGIDLVEILLPHNLHLDAALKAIQADKCVSLQKPMCVSLFEADQLIEAADAAVRPVKVFENFIFYPPVQKAKQLIDEGAIGEPLAIRIKSNPGGRGFGWDVPRSSNQWRQSKGQSGGGPLVFDDGHHKFALAWHFMGNPLKVHAFIGHTLRPDGFYFDAQSVISFTFPGNRIGSLEIVYSPELEVATRHYAQDDRVEITGTKGVIWINGGHGSLGNPPPVAMYRDGEITEFRDIESGWEMSFVLSTRHFICALIEGREPVLKPQEARQILRFALAAEESAARGRAIDLQPTS